MVIFTELGDTIYAIERIEEHEELSLEFDLVEIVEKPKKKNVYIPPMSHPWKQASFNKCIDKQKHRQEINANVL